MARPAILVTAVALLFAFAVVRLVAPTATPSHFHVDIRPQPQVHHEQVSPLHALHMVHLAPLVHPVHQVHPVAALLHPHQSTLSVVGEGSFSSVEHQFGFDRLCITKFYQDKSSGVAECAAVPGASSCTLRKSYYVLRGVVAQTGYVCMKLLDKTCMDACEAAPPGGSGGQVCCAIMSDLVRTVRNACRCTNCEHGIVVHDDTCDRLPTPPPPTPSPTPLPELRKCDRYNCGDKTLKCCASHSGRALVAGECTCRRCWGGWPMNMAFCTRYENFHAPFDCDSCTGGSPVCCVTILGYRSVESACKCNCIGGMVRAEGTCPVEGNAVQDLRNRW